LLESGNEEEPDYIVIARLQDLKMIRSVKHLIIETYKDISLIKTLSAKEDYFIDVSEILTKAIRNCQRNLPLLEGLVAKYSEDGEDNLKAYDMVRRGVLEVVGELREHKERLFAKESGKVDLEEEIVFILDKSVPMKYLFSSKFGIPLSKLINAVHRVTVPKNEMLLALFDLTVNGSSKDALLFGIKEIYSEKGSMTYEDLCKGTLTFESGNQISLPNGIKISGEQSHFDELNTLIAEFQQYLSFLSGKAEGDEKKPLDTSLLEQLSEVNLHELKLTQEDERRDSDVPLIEI